MIGAKVSHQQVPVKNVTPKIQPVINDLAKDSFSRSSAKSNGIRAMHAKNQNSKSGNAKIKRIAEKIAKSEFESAGNLALMAENFIPTV